MTDRVVVISTPHSDDHQPPVEHPDSPERVAAVLRGASRVSGVEFRTGRLADQTELELVHTSRHIAQIRALSDTGGGWLDEDTFVSAGTYQAAAGAVGSGLVAAETLIADPDLKAAFVVARPPGHHATADAAAGFCFFNNIAVAASYLAKSGARVAIVDWDAHHGDGTQDIFWSEEAVLYISLHQENIFPGTGYPHERGPINSGLTTVNLPLPAGATGDRYLRLLDDIVAPMIRRHGPDWILVSCGFDAHTDDPLSEMALEAGDFALFASRILSWASQAARTALFLEGGYHLASLEASSEAVLSVLTDQRQPLPLSTTGGPGADRVDALSTFWSLG